MSKFKQGDVVALKSGGPKMTISHYIEPIDIEALAFRREPKDLGESVVVSCKWFDGKKPFNGRYHQDLLDLVPDA